MKVLSIKQPWVDAILWGGKRVENRSWMTTFRGRFALHASLQPDRTEPALGTPLHHFLATRDPRLGPLGALVGSAVLHDAHPAGSACGCDVWGEQAPGRHHLVLRDVRALQTPIPYRGSLGLRELDPNVGAMVAHLAVPVKLLQ